MWLDYTTLGRTGLRVSVIGLGGGGHSRLGLSQHKSDEESISVVQTALRLGVNFIDTAEAYGTESRIGEGLIGTQRDAVVLSSKYSLYHGDGLRPPAQLELSVDASLRRLKTDYIDVYHLHAVKIEDYPFAVDHLVPELIKMRDKGKIRFLGITEAFAADPSHILLETAVEDDCWDVIMVGFNLLNQSARDKVLRRSIEKNLGVLDMFAVRRALAGSQVLLEFLNDMVLRGLIAPDALDRTDPLGFLLHSGVASSVPDAAYRFVRHEPGIHVVLSGTGSVEHLIANVKSANRGPLPPEVVAHLRQVFAAVDSVSGN